MLLLNVTCNTTIYPLIYFFPDLTAIFNTFKVHPTNAYLVL